MTSTSYTMRRDRRFEYAMDVLRWVEQHQCLGGPGGGCVVGFATVDSDDYVRCPLLESLGFLDSGVVVPWLHDHGDRLECEHREQVTDVV